MFNYRATHLILLISLCTLYKVRGYHDSISTIGYSASERDPIDGLSGKVFIPDALQTLAENGKIISFNYYSSVTDVKVKFQIWRPVSGNRYTLIYQSSTVRTDETETGSYSFDESSNEWAEAGDTVGIYFEDDNPIPYTADASCTLMEYPLAANSGSVGDTTTFSEVTTSECRTYSLQVEVVYEHVDATGLNCTYITVEDSYQYLTSHDYDGSTQYTEDTHDCWVLEAASDRSIRILFDSLDFEEAYTFTGECASDFLEFHDGNDFWDGILDEVCGTTYPTYGINSTSRYVYLRMVADDNGINGLGFQLQYKAFDPDTSSSSDKKKQTDGPVDVAVILIIVFSIIALLLIIPIVILWVRTKRQRDRERRDKLKDNDFLELDRNRMPAWSPEPPRGKTPRLDVAEQRNKFLQSKHARNVPDAPSYHNPRETDGPENAKIKHWSKLTAGVRWNPVRKQFKVGDISEV